MGQRNETGNLVGNFTEKNHVTIEYVCTKNRKTKLKPISSDQIINKLQQDVFVLISVTVGGDHRVYTSIWGYKEQEQ